MLTNILSSWPLFSIAFGAMLFLTLVMAVQSVHFYTNDVILRRFNIMELQIPSTPLELVNIIKGLYKLPEDKLTKAVKSLKGQLYVDFIFMPFFYGSILLLCIQVSQKMTLTFGVNIFMILALLQLLAWLCDIIENVYLLGKIKRDVVVSTKKVHKAYLAMECVKWGIILISIICAVSAIFYFWLTGHYTQASLKYLVIIIAEIVAFLIISKVVIKRIVVS